LFDGVGGHGEIPLADDQWGIVVCGNPVHGACTVHFTQAYAKHRPSRERARVLQYRRSMTYMALGLSWHMGLEWISAAIAGDVVELCP
jgi:hypothetical protein